MLLYLLKIFFFLCMNNVENFWLMWDTDCKGWNICIMRVIISENLGQRKDDHFQPQELIDINMYIR